MIEYKWEIVDLQRDVETGFVASAKWKLTASDGVREEVAQGHCGFEYDPNRPVLPFEELTEDTVLTWVWACGFDKASNEVFLEDKLNKPVVQQPVIVSGTPWAKPEVIVEEPFVDVITEVPLVEEPTVILEEPLI